jgi:ABC-type spermidine/putrescine transport system permease subunit I
MLSPHVLFVSCAFLFLGLTGWLIHVFFFHQAWKKLIEKEYAFHCRKGWIPERLLRYQRDFGQSNYLRISLLLLWLALTSTLLTLAKVIFY